MDAACNIAQVDRITVQPGVNVYIFSPSRGSNSIFAKWLRKIKPLKTSVDGSEAQERNSNCSGLEKVGVKSLPSGIVADLDPSKRVNLANSIIRKNQKMINFGLLSFDALGKPNIAFALSIRANSLNSTWREIFKADWLASQHDLKRVS